ncbi:hypothetical protein ABD91_20115 [Lysinibacillus sphaericus]|uniref:AAA family ATPase n=1 Tax=Lysinibacillus sphaericus TaxID=1421 RepID=UPI0018CE45A6|nr:AAA family ATPase [Lysinibacillus sphaericus]MBG9693066.1 hypothetical protein [Lysinibacillus sphaericus]
MSKKVLAVMSVIPGNGAKFAATNLAKLFAEDVEDDEKVLLIDFDFDYPYLGGGIIDGDDSERTVDDIFPLLTEVLEENVRILKDLVVETNISNVDLIKGTKYAGLTKFIQPEQIQWTIEAAREIYEKVIIVISPSASNVGTLYTLMKAEQIVLVARQNHSNVEHMYDVMRIIRQYSSLSESVKIVYNYDSSVLDIDFSEVFERSFVPVEVVGALSFDVTAVDNKDLIEQKRGFFQSKSVNQRNFNEVYEGLLEGEDE